jgi:hypothetical protein
MAERVSGRAEPRQIAARPHSTAEEPNPGPDSPNRTPGHPHAEGTLPMARILTDPAVEEWIQQMAASAPPMSEDQRARLSRLFRIKRTSSSRPIP